MSKTLPKLVTSFLVLTVNPSTVGLCELRIAMKSLFETVTILFVKNGRIVERPCDKLFSMQAYNAIIFLNPRISKIYIRLLICVIRNNIDIFVYS